MGSSWQKIKKFVLDVANRRDSAMALVREPSLTAYDATYLDLALYTDAVLATFYTQLANAMRPAGEVISGDL